MSNGYNKYLNENAGDNYNAYANNYSDVENSEGAGNYLDTSAGKQKKSSESQTTESKNYFDNYGDTENTEGSSKYLETSTGKQKKSSESQTTESKNYFDNYGDTENTEGSNKYLDTTAGKQKKSSESQTTESKNYFDNYELDKSYNDQQEPYLEVQVGDLKSSSSSNGGSPNNLEINNLEIDDSEEQEFGLLLKFPLTQLEDYFERANFPNVDIILLRGEQNEEGAENNPPENSDFLDANAIFQIFQKTLKQTRKLLAHASKFLPEATLAGFDKQVGLAARTTPLTIPDDTKLATELLLQIQDDLAKETSPLTGQEAKVLRSQIAKRLSSGDKTLLTETQLEQFNGAFQELNVDDPSDPNQQVEQLRNLYYDLDNAVENQIKVISDLMVDFEQLQPLVDRALKLYEALEMSDKKALLQSKMADLAKGKIRGELALRQALSEIRGEVTNLLNTVSLQEKISLQKSSMPIDPKTVKIGNILGKGAFGDVVCLDGPNGIRLAGKCIDSGDSKDLKEMQHEEKIYARLGEHPNIAQCYGMQQIEGRQMLVMQQVQGDDLNQVFGKLESDFRSKKTSRTEFLGGLQHLIKGTLQGLAHFESLGIVHKDIKGDNIRMDKNHRPVLLDVGLSQDVANRHENIKSYVPNAPPEQYTKGAAKNKVSNVWDSFAVGKMLFPLMELDEDPNVKYQFVPGKNSPQKAELNDYGSVDPLGMEPIHFTMAGQSVYERDKNDRVTPRKDKEGNILGMALKPTKTPGDVQVGEYDVVSAYVDFMCHLTHPDPKQRLSPLEALKHPFMTQSLIDESLLSKLFDKPAKEEPPMNKDGGESTKPSDEIPEKKETN